MVEITKICVLNGSRQEDAIVNGQWQTQKVTGEFGLPKGIYRLDTAQVVKPADKAEYQGPIIHVSREHAFQKTDAGMVRHSLFTFKQKPEIGENAKIEYKMGKAILANRPPEQQAQAQAKGR